MAGKKRQQSRSGARKAQFAKRAGHSKVNGKSVGGKITTANKERKAATHKVRVAKQAVRKQETTELFEKVCNKYNLDSKGKYALKRLIGTINSHRLTAVLDNTVKDQSWWAKRYNNICPVDDKQSTGDSVVRKETNASALIRSTKLRVFL